MRGSVCSSFRCKASLHQNVANPSSKLLHRECSHWSSRLGLVTRSCMQSPDRTSSFSFFGAMEGRFMHPFFRECRKWSFTRTLFTTAWMEGEGKFVHPDGRTVSLSLSADEKKRRMVEKVKSMKRTSAFKRYNLSPEGKLLWKLEQTQRKLDVQKQRLKKYMLPPDEDSEHDPEIITPEQLQALRKIGYKNRNYVPVGERGIFGGTIENMHQHWKFHETCQIDLHMFPKHKIKEMAKELARLSGGIVIDIMGSMVIMYRGKNYKQPEKLIPDNLLDKRKALFRARYTQSKEMIEENIEKLTARIERLRQQSDVAALVEKMALANPTPRRVKRVYVPKEAGKAMGQNADFIEDELNDNEEKEDADEILYVLEDSPTDDDDFVPDRSDPEDER